MARGAYVTWYVGLPWLLACLPAVIFTRMAGTVKVAPMKGRVNLWVNIGTRNGFPLTAKCAARQGKVVGKCSNRAQLVGLGPPLHQVQSQHEPGIGGEADLHQGQQEEAHGEG